jgi:hypothetical protein
MTKNDIKKLEQVHATLGLIHFAHQSKMTPGEEALFARALEQLFDVIESYSPNQPPAGGEWPDDLTDQWKALK